MVKYDTELCQLINQYINSLTSSITMRYLQTSFLTPPFGFSLFYLRGVAPKTVSTADIYKGAVPFIMIQLVGLLAIFYFPQLVTGLLTLGVGQQN